MKRNFTALLLGLLLLVATSPSAWANNVRITNVGLSGSILSFDLSWDNSWRVSSTAPNNYDAVWLFVKYQDCATNQWNHASVDSVAAVSPLAGDTMSDQKGVMVFRSADGVGNISNATVSLRLAGMPSGNFDFRVFGIEMVYIPEGSYTLGDGTSTGSFRQGNVVANPYTVASENAITISNSGTNLYAASNIATGTINAAYPKGYGAFYIMKYEISQQQIAEYLNTLTSAQVTPRRHTGSASRYTLVGNWPVISANAGNRAVNYLSWDDLQAYLDWSALRPMTEMEYEKACRGPSTFVPGEFAWGTSNITDANTVTADGTASESVSNAIPPGDGIANFNNNIILGPLRCGFNGSGSTDRLTLGATYYGVCEMSGNVMERCITVGNSTGLGFRPNHGDGNLTPFGVSDVPNWPTVLGTGIRGGAWNSAFGLCRISDRTSAIFNNNSRQTYTGGRGARTP